MKQVGDTWYYIAGTPGIEALELNDQTVNFFSRRGPAAPQDFELRKASLSLQIVN